jgi:hypothetical protein
MRHVRRRVASVLGVAATSLLWAGCNALVGFESQYVAVGGGDAAVGFTGVDANSSSVDANPDVAAVDANPSADAGAVDAAGDAPEDSSLGFCALVALEGGVSFCDDFDHGALGQTWNATLVAGDASVALDTTLWTSPPNSFAVTGQGNLQGQLVKTTPAYGEIVVAFEAREDGFGAEGLYEDAGMTETLVAVTLGAFEFDLAVSVNAQNPPFGQMTFIETEHLDDGGATTYATSSSLPPGVGGFAPGNWIRIVLDLQLPSGGDGGTFMVSSDGPIFPLGGPLASPSPGPMAGSVALGMQITGDTGAGDWIFHYDDVTMNWTGP